MVLFLVAYLLPAKFVQCPICWFGVNVRIADCLWADDSTAGSCGLRPGIVCGSQLGGVGAAIPAQHAQSNQRRLLSSYGRAGQCRLRDTNIYHDCLDGFRSDIIGNFAAAFLLNSALLCQILYYGVFVEGLSPVTVFMADVKSVERTRSRSDMEDGGEIEMFRDEEADQV